MSLDARFELRIDGGLVMEIRVHPNTAADAIADMLEDAAASFRNGFESVMTSGDSLAADNVDTDSTGEAHEPPPVEWKHFNYNPANTEAVSTSPQYSDDYTDLPGDDATAPDGSNGDSKPKRDFYGEQPLIGEIPYTINGIPAVTINYHPAMGIGEIADILKDAETDLRNELESRNPLVYNPDTVTLTVPAMRVCPHLTNQMDSYFSKFAIALELEDHEAADKFFSMSEKFYEWMHRNYTPEAIKNSPAVDQLSRRIESFRGIKEQIL
jgi:hypothetical protein